jgi:tight adherence protein C
MLDLLTAATFLFAMCLVWLLARVLLRPRLRTVVAPSVPGMFLDIDASPEQPGDPWVESLAGLLPQSLSARLELDKDLRRAGRYERKAREKFLAMRNSLVISAVLAAGVVVVAIGPEHRTAVIWTLIVGLVAAILAFALPRVILAARAQQRVGRIVGAMPDGLDTINMCLYAGMSLQECLGYVAREMMLVHADLGFELAIVDRQTSINSFEFGLQQFAARIDAPEIVALASLVTQNQRLGTGIVESIREFADTVRLKRRQLAEAAAGRTELFLLFPVIFFLVPSVLLILWGPPILSILDFLQGPSSPLSIQR